MATSGQINVQLPKVPLTLMKEGYLLKRQRGQSSRADLRGLKFQQRYICLTQDFLYYYVDKKVCWYLKQHQYYKTATILLIIAGQKGEKKGEFPVAQMRIIEKVPDNTFQRTFCFQVITII